MSAEIIAKEAADGAKTAVREGTNFIKKAWSLMDAASEKRPPADYLSPKAIQSIQGKQQG